MKHKTLSIDIYEENQLPYLAYNMLHVQGRIENTKILSLFYPLYIRHSNIKSHQWT